MDIYRYFQTDATGHSSTNAYLLALLSYYIYPFADAKGTLRTIPGQGLIQTKFRNLFQDLSRDDPFDVQITTESVAEFAILSNARMVLVAFRGTDDDPAESEWLKPGPISNYRFRFRHMPDSWGKVGVHDGYYEALRRVYQELRSEVRARRSAGRLPVYLTGHSRGGALAILCAYRFEKVGSVPVAGVYTFGSPRMGDTTFAKAYQDIGLWNRTFRWFRGYDLVSQFPDYDNHTRRNATTRYRHVGQLNYIHPNGRVSMDLDNHDYEPGILRFITAQKHHMMDQYCLRMLYRVSGRQRIAPDNPAYLTKHDLSGALPVIPG